MQNILSSKDIERLTNVTQVIPKAEVFEFFKKLTERVTIINKTEQVIIREDDSVEKIVSQSATAVVSIVALADQGTAAAAKEADQMPKA